jgi:hypothetical protein
LFVLLGGYVGFWAWGLTAPRRWLETRFFRGGAAGARRAFMAATPSIISSMSFRVAMVFSAAAQISAD